MQVVYQVVLPYGMGLLKEATKRSVWSLREEPPVDECSLSNFSLSYEYHYLEL